MFSPEQDLIMNICSRRHISIILYNKNC